MRERIRRWLGIDVLATAEQVERLSADNRSESALILAEIAKAQKPVKPVKAATPVQAVTYTWESVQQAELERLQEERD